MLASPDIRVCIGKFALWISLYVEIDHFVKEELVTLGCACNGFELREAA
jgi:hypothetical protein